MMRLLLIHGRAQGGRNPDILLGEWRAALDKGLAAGQAVLPENVTIDFPFYGDELDRFTAQFDVAVDEIATGKGVGRNEEFAEFAREIASEAQLAKNIADAEVRARLQALHGRNATSKGPANWEWVQSIISILDDRAPGATERVFSRFLRDVFLYTRRNAVRRAIDRIVADKLTDEPTVVVGHSLGSVVAYNVLKAAGTKAIRGFVTVGSPLGIKGIRESLDSPLMNVSGTGSWLNAYDPRDVVALNPLSKPHFEVNPAITNDATLVNVTDNHHGIVSYLDKAIVAKSIAAALV